MPVSVGVKVTPCKAGPAFGTVLGVVKAKLPPTVVLPPLRTEDASVWPKVIAVAVGQAVITGVA